eukprot:TRINITY_DN62109_c0_g1_i1.p1 TRINITY_DN62109_c0_g1~~TRINITY_DN62109_c0_g1_i1.p1  ORF type:complete len:135 (+),score=42.27 TRINITY_DN62109_c0_g1_i1:85-489(+)
MRALAFLLLATAVQAKLSDHWSNVREKCVDALCETMDHPILDWNEAEGCHCRQHPCHNDNGMRHSCDDPGFPFLAFEYDADQQLSCVCKPHPCPEDTCEAEGHIVKWDHNGHCYCQHKEHRVAQPGGLEWPGGA